MKIVLVGYMASGKSSIGKKIAKLLRISFLDLDAYIAEKEALSVPEIFNQKGEIYFRQKEAFYLSQLLTRDKNLVLAVGGGTPCYGNNLEVIKEHAQSFYLKATLVTLHHKLSKPKNKKKRPLIAEIVNEDLKEFIAKHLFERTPYYEEATFVIPIDGKPKKAIAREISLKMRS